MFLYWFLKPALFLLTRLPLKVLYLLGGFFGTVLWYLNSGRRKVAIKNAEIIGASNPKIAAKQSFKNTFKAYMEIFYAQRVDKKFIDKFVTFNGVDNFYNTQKNYPSFIMVGAHFGPWGMLINMVGPYFGIKTVTIGRASKNKSMERILEELRSSENVAYLTHRGAIVKLKEFMEKGYKIGVYLDHTATPKDCVNVDFFGYKAPTIAGIPAFAAKQKLPLVMFFPRYTKKGYEITIYPPIFPDENLKAKERIKQIARSINKTYEDVFKKYPEQWYLMHRRFKRVEEADGTISDSVYR